MVQQQPAFLGKHNSLLRETRGILHSEDHASWYILIIKPTICTNSSNLFLE